LSAFCTECGAPLGDGVKFCGACGARCSEPVPSTVRLAQGERRNMTVLFADLVGSTQMIDGRDPEELLDSLAVYRMAIRQTVDRFGGFILHYLGDGVVVCFGYPIANEDAAERAVRAGLAIVEAIGKLGPAPGGGGIPLQVRVGIATGVIVSQGNAATARIEDNFTGSALNIASRLQSLAAPGEVVMAQSTARLVEGLFETRALGPQILKGFVDPIDAFVPTAVRAGRSRFERRLEATRAPLINRHKERDVLKGLFNDVCAGSARFINLVGEPGIGKSRLAHALNETIPEGSFQSVSLQCNAALVNTVLHPHIDLLQRQCGIADHDEDAVRLTKLRAFLDARPAADPDALALLASLLGIFGDDVPAVRMSPPEQRGRTLAVLEDLMLAQARDKPLIMVYEDLHWADPTSLDFLSGFLEASRTAPLMLIATARPGHRLEWAERDRVITLAIDRLTAGDSSLFAEAIARDAGLSPADVSRIVAKTDGVPLFVEEMTRMMLEQPDRNRRGDLPESLSDLLAERLDRLGPARRLMQVSAVIGREFSPELLARVMEQRVEDLGESLQAILSSGLIDRGPGSSFIFKHALIQDAAYASLLARPRRDLHARVAECLIADFAEIAEREPEMVARHLTLGGKPHAAAGWWLRAGGAAIGRGSAQEAAALLQSGLDALADQPDDEARRREELSLLAVLGPAQMVMKGPGSPDFGAVQRRAYDTCRSLPDAPSLFRITYGLALFHWGKAQFSTALPLAEALDATKAADPSEEHILAAGNMNGMIRLHLGDAVGARSRLTETVGLYRPERHAPLYPHYMMDFGVFGRFYLGIACAMTGAGDIGANHARDAVTLAEALGQPHSRGFSMLANFIVAMLRDDVATAREWATRCRPFCVEMGFPEFVAFADVALGWADIREGSVEPGLQRLEQGIAAWKATGFETWQTWFGAMRAQALVKLGRGDEARAEIAEQSRRAAHNGEQLFAGYLGGAI
jgi:class 3 adenylate cyclase